MILCAGAGAKNWDGEEAARPLRTKGKRQAQKIGAWLGQHRRRPDHVVAEHAARAMATAEKALKAAGWTARSLRASAALSSGSLPDLDGAKRPLLVARPDIVATLLPRLLQETTPAPGVLFSVDRSGDHSGLLSSTIPGELPDLFPFPAPDGPERRPRPAYYYRQSAVIPYRRTEAGTQILIVGSSSGRHWTVPKGIVEPGLSAAASARIEAREEAGVEGRVGRSPLGHFTYAKWGATCDVTVYAMEVGRMLEGPAWQESHRTRQWVLVPEAVNLLKQPAFALLAAKI